MANGKIILYENKCQEKSEVIPMEKRKLASVQYVHHITPIEGADRIECVHVLGWKCVTNKGMFQIGDHCVYMEVDSFLPV